MLRHVDLCSGIGGFALGFEWAGLSKPVMFCDIEPWSRKILAKHWPDVPIEKDVKVLANEPERIPECSILTAGYPCQPFSLAGKRGGEEDDRHIWPYIREIVAQKRPTWCVFENVYGHLSMGLDTVLSNLEADGYSTRPFIVPACSVDAPHRRDRIWIVGYSDNARGGTSRRTTDEKRQATEQGWQEQSQSGISGSSADVANAANEGSRQRAIGQMGKKIAEEKRAGHKSSICTEARSPNVANAGRELRSEGNDSELAAQEAIWSQRSISNQSGSEGRGRSADVANADSIRSQGFGSERHAMEQIGLCRGEAGWQTNSWKPEPPVGRVANGIPGRVDRLRGLGNAIVPQIAMQIGLTIKAVNDAI